MVLSNSYEPKKIDHQELLLAAEDDKNIDSTYDQFHGAAKAKAYSEGNEADFVTGIDVPSRVPAIGFGYQKVSVQEESQDTANSKELAQRRLRLQEAAPVPTCLKIRLKQYVSRLNMTSLFLS